MKKKISILIYFLIILDLFIISCDYSDKKIREIEERGKIIVGTSPPYGIMEYYDENNNLVGFDIDLAKEIANRLNLDLEIREVHFDKFIEELEKNKIDLMISSITITYDRNKNVEFSLPYFNGGQALVVKNIYLNYYDLEGKKILIEDGGSDNKNKVFEILENFTVIYYYESQGMPYFNKALEEINKGNIDGFVIDYIAAVDAIKKNKNLTILGPFSDEYYGIAVKKENKDLIKKINKILIQLKESGRLDKMKQKWIK